MPARNWRLAGVSSTTRMLAGLGGATFRLLRNHGWLPRSQGSDISVHDFAARRRIALRLRVLHTLPRRHTAPAGSIRREDQSDGTATASLFARLHRRHRSSTFAAHPAPPRDLG